MSDPTMEVLPLPRCCPTLRGLLLGTPNPNKCTLRLREPPLDVRWTAKSSGTYATLLARSGPRLARTIPLGPGMPHHLIDGIPA
jgi:hypothetical protein